MFDDINVGRCGRMGSHARNMQLTRAQSYGGGDALEPCTGTMHGYKGRTRSNVGIIVYCKVASKVSFAVQHCRSGAAWPSLGHC